MGTPGGEPSCYGVRRLTWWPSLQMFQGLLGRSVLPTCQFSEGEPTVEGIQEVLAHGTSTMDSVTFLPRQAGKRIHAQRVRWTRSCRSDWGVRCIPVTRQPLAAERLLETLLSQSLARMAIPSSNIPTRSRPTFPSTFPSVSVVRDAINSSSLPGAAINVKTASHSSMATISPTVFEEGQSS